MYVCSTVLCVHGCGVRLWVVMGASVVVFVCVCGLFVWLVVCLCDVCGGDVAWLLV